MSSPMLLKLCAVFCLLMIGTLADVSHLANNNVNSNDLLVTDTCLGCICEASSGCDRNLKCNGDVCGMFRITWAYWSDSGKPTQQGESVDSETECLEYALSKPQSG
ncbi:CLUMA_CG009054, isoform A [Clunio marinus]|uniref:lysozyme n=1 Tax=Clunio marinus TaxID=568069 RepID=A0A1J1I5Y4_9DIPT|nr:CLUMA_CG009054, isoform A [Clunio marinus]